MYPSYGWYMGNVPTRRGVQLLCIPFNRVIASSWDGFGLWHQKRWFFQRAGGCYQPIQMAFWPPTLPKPTSVRILNEQMRKLAKLMSLGMCTKRTKKLAEPTRLSILTERTKQRLGLFPMENLRNDLFQPLSRTSKNGSSQEYSQEYTVARNNVCWSINTSHLKSRGTSLIGSVLYPSTSWMYSSRSLWS